MDLQEGVRQRRVPSFMSHQTSNIKPLRLLGLLIGLLLGLPGSPEPIKGLHSLQRAARVCLHRVAR